MAEQYFIVSDVHGHYELLCELLTHWDRENQTLILLGDMGDRGPQTKECYLAAKQLVEEEGAIYIKGNHEKIIHDWLKEPREAFEWFLKNGGGATIESLLGVEAFEQLSPEEMAAAIQETYADLLDFIATRPLYFECDEMVCVHAGINVELDDWHQTSERDFIWQREPFLSTPYPLDKPIIFGHTVTNHLWKEENRWDIWQHEGKIGIDTGASYGGFLTGIIWKEGTIHQVIQIPSQEQASLAAEEG